MLTTKTSTKSTTIVDSASQKEAMNWLMDFFGNEKFLTTFRRELSTTEQKGSSEATPLVPKKQPKKQEDPAVQGLGVLCQALDSCVAEKGNYRVSFKTTPQNSISQTAGAFTKALNTLPHDIFAAAKVDENSRSGYVDILVPACLYTKPQPKIANSQTPSPSGGSSSSAPAASAVFTPTPVPSTPPSTSPQTILAAAPSSVVSTPQPSSSSSSSTTNSVTNVVEETLRDKNKEFVRLLSEELISLEQKKLGVCCPGFFGRARIQQLSQKQRNIGNILDALISLEYEETKTPSGADCLIDCMQAGKTVLQSIEILDAKGPTVFGALGLLRCLLEYKQGSLVAEGKLRDIFAQMDKLTANTDYRLAFNAADEKLWERLKAIDYNAPAILMPSTRASTESTQETTPKRQSPFPPPRNASVPI
ncbi:MAG: hypothetical protein WCW01_01890 [Gammaproteobacteria bacterium]